MKTDTETAGGHNVMKQVEAGGGGEKDGGLFSIWCNLCAADRHK